MSTIGELAETLNEAPHDLYEESVKQSLYEILDFLDTLPQELDLASAAYYLRKEFKKSSTGIDDRYPVEVVMVDPDDDDWDDWEDDDFDDYYCCEDCG